MEQVYLNYSEDREAAVFYALALDTTALPTDKTFASQKKAAEILILGPRKARSIAASLRGLITQEFYLTRQLRDVESLAQ
jgi:hypothetical protein